MALGSQDSKVTVWLSNAQRPLVVASRMFKQSVVDLAWTPDGYTLLACSTDGTIGVLQFEPHELGAAMSQARRARTRTCRAGQARGAADTRACRRAPSRLTCASCTATRASAAPCSRRARRSCSSKRTPALPAPQTPHRLRLQTRRLWRLTCWPRALRLPPPATPMRRACLAVPPTPGQAARMRRHARHRLPVLRLARGRSRTLSLGRALLLARLPAGRRACPRQPPSGAALGGAPQVPAAHGPGRAPRPLAATPAQATLN